MSTSIETPSAVHAGEFFTGTNRNPVLRAIQERFYKYDQGRFFLVWLLDDPFTQDDVEEALRVLAEAGWYVLSDKEHAPDWLLLCDVTATRLSTNRCNIDQQDVDEVVQALQADGWTVSLEPDSIDCTRYC